MVTVFCPLMMAGTVELVIQAVGKTFVVDNRANPPTLVGHVKTTLVRERLMFNCGVELGA